ncbi:MAG TPA: zinc ribbon domain-containing protein [Candidatus Limnocylindrales bacterium]|nr:zinc ribbon domain-containing protein [Candidatus Limnocylindrales bacterium]
MTVNLLQRKKRGSATPDAKPTKTSFAIGENEARVSYCPSCGTPVSEGTWRCPGCGGKLILGVPFKRGAAVLAVGFALGILTGGVVAASAISVPRGDSAAQEAAVATSVPLATAIPTAPPVAIAAPQAAVTALSGTALVNGRIAAESAALASTLADSKAPTIDIARALRSLSADATQGIDLAARLAPWTEADAARDQLDHFYRTVSSTATLALRVSLNDGPGYRRSATEMMRVLSGLAAVDAASRTLAATVDLQLPPVLPAEH